MGFPVLPLLAVVPSQFTSPDLKEITEKNLKKQKSKEEMEDGDHSGVYFVNCGVVQEEMGPKTVVDIAHLKNANAFLCIW